MSVAFAPRPWVVATLVAVTAAGCVAAATTPFPGRFLFLVVAVAGGAESVRSLLLRPTLRADEHGLEVVSGFRRERHPWSAVANVTPLGEPGGGGHLRRRANALEIDLGDRLLLVPAYRLGTSAEEATRGLGPYLSVMPTSPRSR